MLCLLLWVPHIWSLTAVIKLIGQLSLWLSFEPKPLNCCATSTHRYLSPLFEAHQQLSTREFRHIHDLWVLAIWTSGSSVSQNLNTTTSYDRMNVAPYKPETCSSPRVAFRTSWQVLRSRIFNEISGVWGFLSSLPPPSPHRKERSQARGLVRMNVAVHTWIHLRGSETFPPNIRNKIVRLPLCQPGPRTSRVFMNK